MRWFRSHSRPRVTACIVAVIIGGAACVSPVPPVHEKAHPSASKPEGTRLTEMHGRHFELVGESFRAELEDAVVTTDGSVITIASRSRAPVLAIRTQSIRRGAALPLGVEDAQLVEGAVVARRAHSVEKVRAGPRAVEQSWVFDARPPGQGDLVVNLEVSGYQLGELGPRGIALTSAAHVAHYGHGTWIDADGRRTAIPVSVDASRLVLVVPERVLESSAFPAELDPIISPPIPVDDSLTGFMHGVNESDVGSDGTEFLAAWTTFGGAGYDPGIAVVARFALDGTILSPSPMRISGTAEAGGGVEVARGDTGYLVRFGGQARVVPDGATTLSTPVLLVGRPGGAAWWDGVQYHVAWTGVGGGIHGVRISSSGTLIDFDDRLLRPTGLLRDVACGTSGCLMLLTDGTDLLVSRLAADGTLIDEPAISVSSTTETKSGPKLTAHGDGWVAVWHERVVSGGPWELFAARMDATGTVLDPGGAALTSGGSDGISDVESNGSVLAVVGARAVGSYDHQQVAYLISSDLVLSGPYLFAVNSDRLSPRVSTHGGDFAVVGRQLTPSYVRNVVGSRLVPDGTTGDPFLISRSRRQQMRPDVTFNGTHYFAIWQDHGAGTPAIHGTRIAPDGTVLDSPALVVTSAVADPAYPQVASRSDGFYVVWQEPGTSATDTNVRGSRVSNAGEVLDPGGVAIATDPSFREWRPDVAGSGTATLVHYLRDSIGYVVSVGADGAPGAAAPSGINDATKLTSNATTFMVADESGRYIRRYDLAGAPLESVRTGPCGSYDLIDVTWDGTGWWFLCDERLRRLDGDDTTLSWSPMVSLGVPWPTYAEDVAFDGRNLIVSLRGSTVATETTVVGTRVSPAGRVLGSSFDVSAIPGRHYYSAVASDGSGRSLFVYEHVDYDDAVTGPQVRARLVSFLDDGSSCTDPTDCGSGWCVDGVCCEGPCGGESTNDCQACSVAAGASADGVCTAIDSGRVCRPAVGPCDAEETCDGSSFYCPADGYLPSTTTCRSAVGSCDLVERCTGWAPDCPPDAFVAAGTECRPSAGPCDRTESCTGTLGHCPYDLAHPDGVRCDDGLVCNGREECTGGACLSTGALDCDDGDPCTADSCSESGGCFAVAIAGCCATDAACADGDACTDDACVDNVCVSTPSPSCVDGGTPEHDAGGVGSEDGGVRDASTPGIDAGPTVADAGPGDASAVDAPADAAVGPEAPPEGDGCGCRVPGAKPSRSGWLPLALLLPLLWLRRRRRVVAHGLVAVICALAIGCGDTPRRPDASVPTDARSPDSAPPDAAAPDAPDGLAFGSRCTNDEECASAFCLLLSDGSGRCTRACGDPSDCGAANWTCTTVPGSEEAVCDCELLSDCGENVDLDCDGSIDVCMECGGEWVRPDDTRHCGECGRACVPRAVCADGACACPRAEAPDTCPTGCTNLARDSSNCGACGNACPTGVTCMDGVCPCAGDGVACEGTCTDLATDEANCGACGNTCPSGVSCMDGSCRCSAGLWACGGACVELATDEANCGACGVVCRSDEECVDGSCRCSGGRTLCGGVCIDTSSSMAHCGACDNTCAAGGSCLGGSCQCPTGETDCGTACSDLDEPAHCGSCGNACALGATCIGGECYCPGGGTVCSGTCRQLDIDTSNCGACGRVCPTGSTCEAGGCVCPTAQTLCSDACVDLSSDVENCGACDNTCVTDAACVDGLCRCPAAEIVCGGACIDVSEDVANCGACGNTCVLDCSAGTCADSLARIDAGHAHSCAVTSEGYVYCWGNNSDGQLGGGSTASRSTVPVRVPRLTGVVGLAIGDSHNCVLRNDASVWCWGLNDKSQTGSSSSYSGYHSDPREVLLDDVVALAAGGPTNCALVQGGLVYCWGGNYYGQLGNGGTANSRFPVRVPLARRAVSVDVHATHGCAVLDDGSIQCWGNNSTGALGDGTTINHLTPGPLALVTNAVQVGTGFGFTCARRSDGTGACWGLNNEGQVGDGSTTDRTTPVALAGIDSAVELRVGHSQACMRLSGGTGRCWGLNHLGQFGDGTTTSSLWPTASMGATGVTQFAMGNFHGCALTSSTEARCWGSNLSGQLGDGSVSTSYVPVSVLW